jgi:hypothetical protein
MLKETDGELRRMGAYHSGVKTAVVAARMPVVKVDAVKAAAHKLGLSISEYIEWLFDTQGPQRKRNNTKSTGGALSDMTSP